MIDAKKELGEDPEFSYQEIERLLGQLNIVNGRSAEMQVYGKPQFKTPFDRYMVNREYAKNVSAYKDKQRILESMLPESNRLSGNKHDAEENSRLAGQDLFK